MQISTIQYGAAALVGAAIGVGTAVASRSVDERAMDDYDAGTSRHFPTMTSTKVGTIVGAVGVGGGIVLGGVAILRNMGTAMTGGIDYLSLRPYGLMFVGGAAALAAGVGAGLVTKALHHRDA